MHFSKSIFFEEFTYYVLNIHIYIYVYIVEQRVYLSFKAMQTRTQHKRTFHAGFLKRKGLQS